VDRVGLDKQNKLHVYLKAKQNSGLPFGSLSGGEQAALLVELAIVRTRNAQGAGPTLLVIDPWPTITQQFGPELGILLAELASNVQVFVTTSTELNFNTPGWVNNILATP
jgi:hypothetical protein